MEFTLRHVALDLTLFPGSQFLLLPLPVGRVLVHLARDAPSAVGCLAASPVRPPAPRLLLVVRIVGFRVRADLPSALPLQVALLVTILLRLLGTFPGDQDSSCQDTWMPSRLMRGSGHVSKSWVLTKV